jgi:hypothetical protein
MRPIEAGSGEQLDFVGMDTHVQAVAVVLDLVSQSEPSGASSARLVNWGSIHVGGCADLVIE